MRTCLPSSCIFQGSLLTTRPQHTRPRECKDDCHCHCGTKSGSERQAGLHYAAPPGKHFNCQEDQTPRPEALLRLRCPTTPPARSTLGRRLRGARLAGSSAVTDGAAVAAAAAAQGSAEPPLHRSAARRHGPVRGSAGARARAAPACR